MCFQIACLGGCIVTLTALVWFFSSVFLSAFSNCLPEKMHGYTLYIGLIFLQCVLSNVSLKHLDQSMQSHTGCIRLAFVHYVFLDAPLSCLYMRRHIHIGYICLAFLSCAFSYVSSNSFSEGMQSHTGCIFWHCSAVFC